ncbi:MAG: phosphatase PAP2 family protein [Leadbetterella sp.]|nr:phosphatase PAP2 family protein [Leadbetterella sp.]
MIETILEFDKQLFLYLNGFHTTWLDAIMLFFSKSKVWIPLYLILVVYLFKNYGSKDGLRYVIFILLAVGLSDFMASGIMKPYFQRLRPCHDFLNEMILVGNCGGKYGFVSSHAANSFALFFSIYKIFGQRNFWTYFLLSWAIIVSYSRIYLGVHFPIDVFLGSFIGILISTLIFEINKSITK